MKGILLLVGLIAAVTFVGCVGGPEPAVSGPVTVTFWHSQKGEAAKLLARLAAEFSAEHPDITLKLVGKPDKKLLIEELRKGVPVGQGPGLAEIPEEQLQLLRSADIVRPLQSFVARRDYGLQLSDLNDFWPCFIKTNSVGRKVWGLPFSHKIYALLYNPELVERPPTTWAELENTARALTVRGSDPARSRFGLAFRPDAEMFSLLLHQNGGRLLNGDGSRWVFNSAEGRRSLDYLYQVTTLRKAGLLIMGSPGEAVADGRAAMAIGEPSWPPASGVEPVAVAPLPQGDYPTTLTRGTSLALVAGQTAAQEEAAWRFMRWLTSPENSARWAASTGDVPVRRTAMDQFVWADSLGNVTGWRGVMTQLDSAVPLPSVGGLPDSGGWETVRDGLSEIVLAYLLGSINSSQAALDGVALPANKALSGP